jgi:hypothetical protein
VQGPPAWLASDDDQPDPTQRHGHGASPESPTNSTSALHERRRTAGPALPVRVKRERSWPSSPTTSSLLLWTRCGSRRCDSDDCCFARKGAAPLPLPEQCECVTARARGGLSTPGYSNSRRAAAIRPPGRRTCLARRAAVHACGPTGAAQAAFGARTAILGAPRYKVWGPKDYVAWLRAETEDRETMR